MRKAVLGALVTLIAVTAAAQVTGWNPINQDTWFKGKIAISDSLLSDSGIRSTKTIEGQRVVMTAGATVPVFSNATSHLCVADSIGNVYFNTDQLKFRVCTGAGGWASTGWTDEDEDGLVATSDPQGIDDDDGTPFTAPTAAAGDVLTGKTFRTGASLSPTTGTMTNVGAQYITPTTSNTTITAGYHSGSGYSTGDGDLVAGNINKAVAIFGVSGTLAKTCNSTGTASYVCSGGNLVRAMNDASTVYSPQSWAECSAMCAGEYNGGLAISCAAWDQVGNDYCYCYTGTSSLSANGNFTAGVCDWN